MLHRMDGLAATGLHRMDWDGAAALGRKALGWFALAGGMFLLCRAQVTPMLAPFAMAFLAAALLAGKSAAALLAGCVAGAINGSIQDFNLRLATGAAIVLGGSIAWDTLRPALKRSGEDGNGPGAILRSIGQTVAELWPRDAKGPAPRMQARSPNRTEPVVCAALAGAGVLIPGMLWLGEAIWPSAAEVAVSSVAAVALAPFFRTALGVRWQYRWLTREERIGLFLLTGFLVAGLARLSMPLALCAGGALSLLMYQGGALAGIGFGTVLLAMGGDARLLALAAVGGATAQLCAELPRPTRSASACGAMLTVGLLLNVSSAMLVGAGAATLAVVPMPERWAKQFSRLVRPDCAATNAQQLTQRVQRQSADRLRALGAAFGELAEGYQAPAALPDEQALIFRLRARLCDGCAGYEGCWTGERNAGARFLCDLIAQAAAMPEDAPLFEGEVPPDVMRRCRRGRLIPERIQNILEDFARARRSELRRGAENRLISAQFLQARRMLEGLADRQIEPLRLRVRQADRAAVALERAGIDVQSVVAMGGRGVEIVAGQRRGYWTQEQARRASAQLSRTFGRVYAAVGPLGREARFVRRPRLRADTGAVCASRQAGAPSGDSHVVSMLDDERLLVLICDGMGSGSEAARESAVAVRLLGRFLRAGTPCPLAIETVNALMLNRGGEEMFATVDMLVLNLSTGVAEFTKLAACPTAILRNGEVRWVEGGRLPLGILEKVQPAVIRTRLLPGDTLLMGSDGVMDAAGGGAIANLLREEGGNMSKLARRALAAAEAACEPGHRDDMTAICVRIGVRE